MNALPKIVRNFNILVDGTSFAGIATEFTPPKITVKEEEHRGGGHDTGVMMDVGMEKMECSFKMAEHHATIFKQCGLRDGQAASLTFRGAKADDKSVESYVYECRGRLNVDPGTITPGGKNEMSASMTLRYLKVSIKGSTVIEIDVDNFKRVIGGQDQLADLRAAIQ